MKKLSHFNASSLTTVLKAQMPWHDGPEALERWRAALPPFRRAVVAEAMHALLHPRDRRHTVVIGLRRIGKTVALRQCVASLFDHGVATNRVHWLRLDHPQLRELPLGDLVRVILHAAEADSENPLYLFLDEVTASHNWDLWLKTFYDESWPIRILATSSATSLLRTVRHESGAGRWREIRLPPWLVHELGGLLGVPAPVVDSDLHRTLLVPPPTPADGQTWTWQRIADVVSDFGGFPEWWAHVSDDVDWRTNIVEAQERLRSDIVQNAIYRDLALAVGIDHPHKLEQLLTILAAQVAQIASPQKLATDIGVAQPTVDRYVAHLSDIHLLFRLYNYAPTEETVQRRGRKVFLADNAVCNAILGRVPWSMSESDRGRLRENQVAVHLQAYANRVGQRLYYWRDAKKREVDFVLPAPASPIAIEVASSASHNRDGLLALSALRPELRGRTWLTWPDAPWKSPESDPDGVGTYPLGTLLAVAGRCSETRDDRKDG